MVSHHQCSEADLCETVDLEAELIKHCPSCVGAVMVNFHKERTEDSEAHYGELNSLGKRRFEAWNVAISGVSFYAYNEEAVWDEASKAWYYQRVATGNQTMGLQNVPCFVWEPPVSPRDGSAADAGGDEAPTRYPKEQDRPEAWPQLIPGDVYAFSSISYRVDVLRKSVPVVQFDYFFIFCIVVLFSMGLRDNSIPMLCLSVSGFLVRCDTSIGVIVRKAAG